MGILVLAMIMSLASVDADHAHAYCDNTEARPVKVGDRDVREHDAGTPFDCAHHAVAALGINYKLKEGAHDIPCKDCYTKGDFNEHTTDDNKTVFTCDCEKEDPVMLAKCCDIDTSAPTSAPSAVPSAAPSDVPTKFPTAEPTSAPSDVPTKFPTAEPTSAPSDVPTKYPTAEPTSAPSAVPSASPTSAPTTATPTSAPSTSPTSAPSASPTPQWGDYLYSATKTEHKNIEKGGYADFETDNIDLMKEMKNKFLNNPACKNATTGKFDPSLPNCATSASEHHLDVEKTFVNYAEDYTRKMDQVQNGIEGLAQLHSTHDEMWHRICAIAERGAKYRMQEFRDAIAKFKAQMIFFKLNHTSMLDAKAKMEAAKVTMTISLQKWLTARKAHAAAHTRYVNFLHHLGLDFNDKNPAARYWREYSHGVTGGTRKGNDVKPDKQRLDGNGDGGYQKWGEPGGGYHSNDPNDQEPDDKNWGGKVLGGWTPLQGPIPYLGQHSHKIFIDKLESIAQTSNKVGRFQDPDHPLHPYVFDNVTGGREASGNPYNSVAGKDAPFGYAQAGNNTYSVTLNDKPFYGDAVSKSGMVAVSQQAKHNKRM